MEKWDIAVSLNVHSFHVKEKKNVPEYEFKFNGGQPQQKIGI